MAMTSRVAALAVAGGLVAALGHSAVVASQQKSVWDGVYTAAQAKRAEPLYSQKCAKCHAEAMTGKDAPAIKGPEFSANWNDLSLNDLFEKIRIAMPDDEKGTLTRPQVADLIALMLQTAEIPEGKTEVPTDAAALKEIKYLGSKP
jgi:cytochrome c